MTVQMDQISLEDVRVRFVDAEARLSDAAVAVGTIREAAERLGSAREGLGAAGARLGELAGALGGVAASLTDNAASLRAGVDAIRAGDPAEIKRRIEELDAAFTAMQSVVGSRLTTLEEQGAAVSTDLEATAAALDAHASASRRDLWIVAVFLGILVIASAVLVRLI
jgi:hypothetical protein